MKKLLLTASGLFLAASLYIGVNSYKNIHSGTNMLLVNVEALTQGGELFPQIPCTEGGVSCLFAILDASGNIQVGVADGFTHI